MKNNRYAIIDIIGSHPDEMESSKINNGYKFGDLYLRQEGLLVH